MAAIILVKSLCVLHLVKEIMVAKIQEDISMDWYCHLVAAQPDWQMLITLVLKKIKKPHSCNWTVILIVWEKSSQFCWASFPQNFHLFRFIFSPSFYQNQTFNLPTFKYHVILNFRVQNQSVVIWLKMCQLHLENCWTFCRAF